MDWTRHLRLRDFSTVVALYETCNLSQTAARMGITQPALSKWLRELEADLGVPLFERHSRGMAATEYGHAFAARARLMINELDRTSTLLKVMAQGGTGQLNVGTTPVAMTDLMPEALLGLQRRQPAARVTIVDGSLDRLLPQLQEGHLDFIVSRLEERRYGGEVAQEVLYLERIAVVTGVEHALAGKRRVSWDEALACPWIGPPSLSPLRAELEQELALARKPLPRVLVETSSTLLVASLLQRTDMLAVMSARPARHLAQAGQLRILELPVRRKSQVGVLWRRDSPLVPLQEAMLAALRQAARHRPGNALSGV